MLEEALAWADGCLIGANTLRLHSTTCLIRDQDLLAHRRAQSRSAQPLERWLLHAVLEPQERPADPVAGFARCLPLSSWPEALEALAAAGLQRLVVLGGAQLAASLLAADCIDALQLTVCPQLLGGPHSWVPSAVVLPHGLTGWRCEQQQLLEGDELLLRYVRDRAA